MIFETESALKQAMQDEDVPECNWLHSSGSKMFKIDLSGIFAESKKRPSGKDKPLFSGREEAHRHK